ncbi:MAG: sigma-70 family RNA polymerase sigma factor [Planctomycetota bacterium]
MIPAPAAMARHTECSQELQSSMLPMSREWITAVYEPGTTRSTMLDGVRVKDAVAWSRMVELYGPLVYSWCRRSRCQPSDAVDVVQEVFLAVAQGVERLQLDRPGDSFRAWLRVITKHKIVDLARRRQQSPIVGGGTAMDQKLRGLAESLSDEEEPSDQDVVDLSELLQRSMQLVRNDFSRSTWQAFWMSTVEGYETAEITSKLQMNANAIRQARFRVLKRIREEFCGEL